MAIFLLIRHGSNDMIERNILAGRTPGVHLNERGRREAKELADRLATLDLQAVYSSPLERTFETAEPIARRQGLGVQVLPAITEMDFGAWTGSSFAELASDPRWRSFNQRRGSTRVPGGEIALEVQLRMRLALEQLSSEHGPGSRLALVSHGDPIRSVIAHCLGLPLDDIVRLQVGPASVSAVDLDGEQAPRVLCLNWSAFYPLDFG